MKKQLIVSSINAISKRSETSGKRQHVADGLPFAGLTEFAPDMSSETEAQEVLAELVGFVLSLWLTGTHQYDQHGHTHSKDRDD